MNWLLLLLLGVETGILLTLAAIAIYLWWVTR